MEKIDHQPSSTLINPHKKLPIRMFLLLVSSISISQISSLISSTISYGRDLILRVKVMNLWVDRVDGLMEYRRLTGLMG